VNGVLERWGWGVGAVPCLERFAFSGMGQEGNAVPPSPPERVGGTVGIGWVSTDYATSSCSLHVVALASFRRFTCRDTAVTQGATDTPLHRAG
jgi:hypothetical protein